MRKETFFQRMNDDFDVGVNRYLPDENIKPKGIVQLSHGMVEYSARYEEFAKALTEAGYIFNAHDHRGHGMTAEKAKADGKGDYGVLAATDGFARVTEDVDEIILRVKHDFPGLPVLLFGHSFGSFVAQAYIEKYAGHIEACILCGTRGPNPLEVAAGKMLTSLVCKVKGRESSSHLVGKLMFGSSNKKIKDAQTRSDWLSRDENLVQKYMTDPWCQFSPSTGFYNDLMTGLSEIHKTEAVAHIPKTLPIFLIAGDADPVGAYGKTVTRLFELYKKIGIQNVTLKLYEGARHELLNDTNKAEVTADVLSWTKKNLI